MNELALFAGAGGGILGGKLLGWNCVCAVELNPYARAVLAARQNDGCLGTFPIWDDVTTFDGRPWSGKVDVVSGGFPCQDISSAGKGAGIEGERSGLWGEFARIIREVGPRYAFVENSPMLTSRGLGRVLGDLASMGYNAEWGVLGASDAIWASGPPCLDHERYRIWILATANHDGCDCPASEARGAKRWSADLIDTGVSSPAYSQSFGRFEGQPESAREQGRPDADERGVRLTERERERLPTPTASMSKGSSPKALTRKSGRSREMDRLDHAVMASHGGQLNPVWVEWFMGWPLGWTDLKPLETDKFQQWLRSHGGS